ncbi:glycosyltransferase family 4 protein [Acinetobacter colistiniresistens]|uniref:glycosyltransferase family 4 protein n=1 Tax=Acinetobacter colistiniresistens TaxID=280145 RepID=UPI00211D087B|nr:glycosyltransferase family 4 protein [Acinetobacter colistiniresistens]UUM28124.1 glycosyltransferase family 4 protein [Acinetobacter colistiniresistens]
MGSKRIALIGTTGASFYGFRADLIRFLIQQGHTVYALTSEYTDQCLLKIKALGAIPITYQLSRGGLNPFADIQSFLQLKKILSAIQPNIAFSYFAKPVIYGSMAAKAANVPLIIGMLEGLGYTFTEQPERQKFKTKLIRNIQVLLYRMAFPCLDKMIFLTADDQHDLMKVYGLNVPEVHILGGIGLNLNQYPFSEVPINPIKFLFIGRLLKEKGIFELIDAMRLVKQKYPQAHFTILGAIDSQNMGALKQEELDRLIEEQLFEYPGYVTNVQDWITETSIFVLPSYREGVPRSTQEAMAIGRPIITTDVPGCRETVVDGVNGFLVPKWNPEALADKMCYFIENPGQVNKMGLKSYEIAQEKFDAEKVNSKLIEIMGLKDLNEKTS